MFRLLTFLSFILTSSAFQCDPGSISVNTTTTICYFPMSSDSFYQAELSCNDIGEYHLPSFRDAFENVEFANIASAYFYCDFAWIGLDSRQQWMDGSPVDFDLTDHTEDPSPGFDCVAYNIRNGQWSYRNCSETLPYICQLRDTEPAGLMQDCLLSSKYQSTIPASSNISITVDSVCSNWQIAVVIVLQDSRSTKGELNLISKFMKELVSECSSSSVLTVFTPSSARNLSQTKSSAVTLTGLTSLFNNLSPSEVSINQNDASTVFNAIFDQMFSYPKFPLTAGFGGFSYVFMDILCEFVCTDQLMKNQQQIIDNITDFGYNIRFVHIGDEIEQNCLAEVFPRCRDYTRPICDMIQANYSYIPDNSNSDFCSSQSMDDNDTPGLSTTWEIVIIVVTIVFALLILMCACWRLYFRYKQLASLWNAFWIKQNNENQRNIVESQVVGPLTAKAQNYYHNVDGRLIEIDDWEIRIDDLEILENELLGSGAFANVYKANLKGEIPVVKKFGDELKLGLKKNFSGEYLVAVKQLPIHANNDAIMDFENEIDFMKSLGYHAHIISLLGAITIVHKPLIVIENCENGDLLTFLRNHEEGFGESLKYKDLYSIAWQVSDGMNYLASNNLIHRDIAARNILLTSNMVAKISDFGLCRLVDSSLYTAKGGRLPIKWMAYESLKYYQYSLKSDIWSFGVMLYELFSFGETPYQTVQPNEMPKYLEEGNRLEKPKMCLEQVYELMTKCWSTHPEDRPTIEEIRDSLGSLLDQDSQTYGYISVDEIQFPSEVVEVVED